jgi:HlyD family secretion protein
MVGIGGWATTTMLSGAVIASGVVVVETSVKKVQHPTGGIVGEIRVKDGDKVMAGDLVIRLDETITRANLQILRNQLDELVIREARLKAELDERAIIDLPAELQPRAGDDQVQSILATEQIVLASRLETCNSQKSQFQERVSQFNNQITGVSGQIDAKAREIEFIEKELADLAGLEERKLVTTSKLVSLRREAVRIRGEHGQLVASVAETKGKIAETELQNLSHLQERRSEIVKELREVQSKRAELAERKVAAEDQLRRVDLRAPQTGVVHDLSVHTVGGVVERGEQLMLIVPEGDKLVVEAQIAPRDIDQVKSGARVNVRFPSFNVQTTPELKGVVSRISADLKKDEGTGQGTYVARIVLDESEVQKLGKAGDALLPGMPAEVQVQTSERTALSYLLKPLEDQVARAFRER